jgi:hypothetical protein
MRGTGRACVLVLAVLCLAACSSGSAIKVFEPPPTAVPPSTTAPPTTTAPTIHIPTTTTEAPITPPTSAVLAGGVQPVYLPPIGRGGYLNVQVTNPGQHGSVPGGGISVTLYVINNSTSTYDLAASDLTALGFDETTTPTTYGNATFSGTPSTTATESNGVYSLAPLATWQGTVVIPMLTTATAQQVIFDAEGTEAAWLVDA